ncbi:hypothetical protein DLREEDagrD3_18620 [Denitratisoma sp. agr-D3]
MKTDGNTGATKTAGPRALDGIYLLLLLGTGLTWWLGEEGRAGSGFVAVLLLIAAAKGGWVIEIFMALRGVKALWQVAVLGWLAMVLLVNLACYWKGS